MAMAIDSRQQQQQPFSGMGFDNMRYPPPQFSNPWVSTPATQAPMYSTSMPATADPHATHAHAQAQAHRYAVPVTGAYSSSAVSAAAMPSGPPTTLGPSPLDALSSLHAAHQDGVARSYAPYTHSQAAPMSSAMAQPPFAAYGYTADRRPSHPSVAPAPVSALFPDSSSSMAAGLEDPVPSTAYIDMYDRLTTATEAERQQFSDALDASRGMVAMSQSDITPRNIYGGGASSARSSTDSYGFPSTHSAHSSISSSSTYPSYYNSSVSDASVGGYSSASESVDMPHSSSRTLPRPAGLVGAGMPPAPQSMMGQFSSKVSSSSQKKHKCKICDKRFTRPSSLQTHMYSHTGEKPFACDVEGCGRHFSVVSNLRRHRKVHKAGGSVDDHPSPDDDE